MGKHWNRAAVITALVVFCSFGLGCHEYDFSSRFEPGEIDIYDDLYSVSVPDERHIRAVGYYGAVYGSDDGGDTWAKLDSGTQASFYSISMADAERGWIVGQRGLIMRTTDGGKSWKQQDNLKQEQGTHLFAVHAIDANTAWVVGEWGTRLFTDDGGTSWQDRSLIIDEQHPRFVWLAPVEQEAVRAGRKVFEDVGFNDVFCLPNPSSMCWAVGEFGYVFHSNNYGLTWERGEIIGEISTEPIELGYNETELGDAHTQGLQEFAALIADQNHLNVDVEPVALRSEVSRFAKPDDPYEFFELLDGRAAAVRTVLEEAGILSDRIRLRGMPPWDYEDFIEDDPDFLKRYLDERVAPKAGIQVRVAQNPYLFRVRFSDEQNGLIAGLGGVVLRSEDGGKTWRYQPVDRKQALFAVATRNGRSIAVGEKGLVRVSQDGGMNWDRPEFGFPTVFTFMRDIAYAPNSDTGFIVGQTGLILRSRDAGASWERVLKEQRKVADSSH